MNNSVIKKKYTSQTKRLLNRLYFEIGKYKVNFCKTKIDNIEKDERALKELIIFFEYELFLIKEKYKSIVKKAHKKYLADLEVKTVKIRLDFDELQQKTLNKLKGQQ
jgi:hypothetical protein